MRYSQRILTKALHQLQGEMQDFEIDSDVKSKTIEDLNQKTHHNKATTNIRTVLTDRITDLQKAIEELG